MFHFRRLETKRNFEAMILRLDALFNHFFRLLLIVGIMLAPKLALADAGVDDGTSAVAFLDNLSSSKWAEVIALVSFFVAMCGLAFGFMGGKSVMGCLFLAAFLKFGPMVIDYFFTNAGSS